MRSLEAGWGIAVAASRRELPEWVVIGTVDMHPGPAGRWSGRQRGYGSGGPRCGSLPLQRTRSRRTRRRRRVICECRKRGRAGPQQEEQRRRGRQERLPACSCRIATPRHRGRRRSWRRAVMGSPTNRSHPTATRQRNSRRRSPSRRPRRRPAGRARRGGWRRRLSGGKIGGDGRGCRRLRRT